MFAHVTHLSTGIYDRERTVQGNKPKADSVSGLLEHPSSN